MPSVTDRLRTRQGALAAAAALAVVALVAILLASTGGDDAAPAPTTAAPTATTAPTAAPTTAAATTTGATGTATTTAGPTGTPCIVQLHGKGGQGAATAVRNGITVVRPTGNADGWGQRQWSYFPDEGYAAATKIVVDAADGAGCGRIVLNGFSNGAAFAAKLYCRGETLGGRVVGVMVDDPVTDHAVEGCRPAAGTKLVLYWTGALEGQAKAGWKCSSADWTCEGGTTIGIAAYAKALGTTAKASPQKEHAANTAAPEPAGWLAGV